MSKILFRLILICVSILLIALMVSAWWRMREIEPLVTLLEPVPVLEESEVESETISLFTFDEGARASFASNP
ncbi:hypothetical protein HQ487_02630, partial [Candidatus Uhrbacteria bacterium]|nr:hypothetical protein [Candidatus Uhrbacteria bacterium]